MFSQQRKPRAGVAKFSSDDEKIFVTAAELGAGLTVYGIVPL